MTGDKVLISKEDWEDLQRIAETAGTSKVIEQIEKCNADKLEYYLPLETPEK